MWLAHLGLRRSASSPMYHAMFSRQTASILRSKTLSVRKYSTPNAKGGPIWSLYLSVAGCVGLGTYVYLDWGKGQTPAKPTQNTSPLDPEKFLDFKLKKIEQYNHNTSKFIFDLPDQQASLLPVASCVVVKSSDPEALLDPKGKPVIRPYTPISSPETPGELTFLIKKYDAGNASKHIHSLKIGESLAIKGPIKKWDYKINEFSDVALIGGGSGITPLYQILEFALSKQENKTKFKLIFANVTEADILMRESFDQMKKQYPNTFDVVYVLDKADQNWKGPTGFINKDLLKEHLAPASLEEKVKIFICGPPGQVAAISGKKDGMKQGSLGGLLEDLGYKSDQVFKF